jgi:hypothetical protein
MLTRLSGGCLMQIADPRVITGTKRKLIMRGSDDEVQPSVQE